MNEDVSGIASEAPTTRDRFFHGGFEALQFARKGHRSGSDALLLAAALPAGASGRVADLGAGAGVAAFAALTANPGLTGTLVEVDADLASLATRSVLLEANRHLRDRVEIVLADITQPAAVRRLAGLADNSFDYVIANPPYHPPHERGSPDTLRQLAHRLPEGGLEPWLRTATAILKPGGMLCLVWRASRLDEALAAMKGRLGEIRIHPLHARQHEAASRVILAGIRGSRAPLAIMPGIVLHDGQGKAGETAEALLNGKARLQR